LVGRGNRESRQRQVSRSWNCDGTTAIEGAGDQIGGLIDLGDIDADIGLAGDQALQFGASTGAGRVWLVEIGVATHLRANADASTA